MNSTGPASSLWKLSSLFLLFTTTVLGQVSYQDAVYRSSQHASEAVRAAQWVEYHSRQAWQNPQRQDLAALAWQWKAYETQQRQWASYYQQFASAPPATRSQPPATAAPPQAVGGAQPPIILRGSLAYGLNSLPASLHRMIQAGNALQGKPYILGGGHRQLEDAGYDCSSSVSYLLIKAGLLGQVLTSSNFASYGAPGPGRFVTLWVKPGQHVFITICGLRLDTSGGQVAEGPRWRTTDRSLSGFMPRHPPGL